MKKIKFYKNEMIEVEIYKLVDFNLASTLGEYQGLGLSANQVGLKDRVCVINMGDEVWSLFNPEITERSAVPSKYQEGCLSYPGLLLTLNRSEWIKVKFQAVGGQWVEEKFSGLTAVCIQHEIDHLDGIMDTDKVSPIKLEQAKRKVKKTLKKMKEASIQYARQQELLEQQKKQEQSIEKPKIQILGLDTAPVQVKTPEKFVYNPIPS
jgi:peptide deformylase